MTDIGLMISIGGAAAGIITAGFTSWYLVRRTAERVGDMEEIIYRKGQGLGVMTLEVCDACRKVCGERIKREADHQYAEIGSKIDRLSQEMAEQRKRDESYRDLQERRWKVITNHIGRTTTVIELMSARETGFPHIDKLIDGLRVNTDDL
jgi:hypothetical protein